MPTSTLAIAAVITAIAVAVLLHWMVRLIRSADKVDDKAVPPASLAPFGRKEPVNHTGIAWTTKTVNPFKGCSQCSPECQGCYAIQWAVRHQAKGSRGYAGTVAGGKFTGVVGIVPDEIDRLAQIKTDLVFVNSMSDTFHAKVPDTAVKAVFDAMAANPFGTGSSSRSASGMYWAKPPATSLE